MGIRLSFRIPQRQALSFLSTYSFADDIRKAFSGEESRSTAAKAVKGAMDEITKLWDAAFAATAKSEGQGKADSKKTPGKGEGRIATTGLRTGFAMTMEANAAGFCPFPVLDKGFLFFTVLGQRDFVPSPVIPRSEATWESVSLLSF